ncbi:MAG: hypothetical protein A3K19_31305 [Lentisphaerae bacterium RIFOXYB12_FULL_65_16]|nr:MAG: hypothetical protein A3K18_22665 [Lentisphaerae bacterium RIFOXYA12_64_32]OGV87172.1 MAG: hypothetical protein A3K19_31305 [Lentisphaerae bacterium RIFOXYB12_FULL_65_16]
MNTFAKVRDVMARGVVTCGVNATADEMARLMIGNHVSALVITDEQLDACGVVTKTDLVARYGQDLSQVTAESIMSATLLTVSPAASVKEAIQSMLMNHVHQLVVVTEANAHRRPVGIFTLTDAVALMGGQAATAQSSDPRCEECVRRFLSISGQVDERHASGPCG